MTYAGCKQLVKPILHGVAFRRYGECTILACMTHKQTYLLEWRKFRRLTQSQVIDRLAIMDDDRLPKAGASLSRLENGKQPYSQRILEALAEIYDCDPASLIGRNPFKDGEIIDLVAILSEREKAQAMAVIQALTAKERA